MASHDKQLRAAIAGAGLMGRWHAAAIERAGGHVTAVVDPSPGAARRLAASRRGAEVFASLEEMIERVSVDVLHICTPPATHGYIAEYAIDRGINVLIEKPLTPAAIGTERLFDRAEERGVVICPVHQFLFQEGVLNAKERLNTIGRLVHLDGKFCSAGGVGKSDEQIEAIAGEILPHPLSLMQSFLPAGLPEEGWITSRPRRGELRAFAEGSGVSLSIFISMNARPTVCSFKLVGTEGTIHVDMFHGFSFVEPGKVSKRAKMIRPFSLGARELVSAAVNLGLRAVRRELAYPGLQRLVSSFYAAVIAGAAPPISREDAVRVASVRDSLLDYTPLDRSINRRERAQCL